jgi:Kef-type K+ transport system membrane component KefB
MTEKNVVPSGAMMALHVLIITLLANLGKMFPAFCYRREATLRERLALSVAMFPRGEVGAGVLVISIGYGLGGPALTVAVLSLSLNLLCTGAFILIVKRLLGVRQVSQPAPVMAERPT